MTVHRYKFVRNIYGDEINSYGGARSIWRDPAGNTMYGPVPFEQKPIFSFDAERNRLVEDHLGGHWAIGVAVVTADRRIVDRFEGMIDPHGLPLNGFTRDRVVPFVDLERYSSSQELLEAFWQFWTRWNVREAPVTIADFGSAVEATLFAAAQALDLDSREFEGPYPLHEVATRLDAAGVDPDIDRVEFSGMEGLQPHNPVDDAIASAISWLRAGEILYNQRYFQ